MKNWFQVWLQVQDYRKRGIIRDRYKSKYMATAITLRLCKENGVA